MHLTCHFQICFVLFKCVCYDLIQVENILFYLFNRNPGEIANVIYCRFFLSIYNISYKYLMILRSNEFEHLNTIKWSWTVLKNRTGKNECCQVCFGKYTYSRYAYVNYRPLYRAQQIKITTAQKFPTISKLYTVYQLSFVTCFHNNVYHFMIVLGNFSR